MSALQIECIDLSVGYDKVPVASGISFSIHSGDYLCLIGENGSGKTTLMKTILGLLPTIDGHLHIAPEVRKGGLGYLPQSHHARKDFPATVYEVVLSGVNSRPWYRPFFTVKEKELITQNLRKIGAENLINQRFCDLSGGQRQRVLLARALCSGKDILLVDEPVAGLDAEATERMYQALRELNRSGVSVVMITHDVKTALSEASHVLLLGEERFYGTVEEFRDSGLKTATQEFVGGHSHHD